MKGEPQLAGLLSEAWLCLGSHPLRTFLAMLGIVIGVGSVVLMMAIGGGSRRAVEAAVNSLGSNILIVVPGVRSGPFAAGSLARFDIRDATEIGLLPLIAAAAPASFPQSFPVSYNRFHGNVNVTMTTPDYFAIREWRFTEGGAFTAEDVRNGARVAVVGAMVAETAFGTESSLGRTLTIKGTPFRVVGALKPKGQGLDGMNQDYAVYVPITTGESRFMNQQLIGSAPMIYVKVASRDALDQATNAIRKFLRERLRLSEATPDCFAINNLSSITQVTKDTANAFSTLLGAIASISLLVGGIGIMNIMLVNVTERIREIGIRKAVGATERQILVQFLLEAILITSVGSLLGLILGVSAGLIAKLWLAIPVAFEPSLAVLAVGVSTVVGVASGFYPAYKAAKMQPIEALRAVGA